MGAEVCMNPLSEGSMPEDVDHPLVAAGREALRGLRPASVLAVDDSPRITPGYLLRPDGDGVRVVWVAYGEAPEVRRVQLEIVRAKLREGGWKVSGSAASPGFLWAARP